MSAISIPIITFPSFLLSIHLFPLIRKYIQWRLYQVQIPITIHGLISRTNKGKVVKKWTMAGREWHTCGTLLNLHSIPNDVALSQNPPADPFIQCQTQELCLSRVNLLFYRLTSHLHQLLIHLYPSCCPWEDQFFRTGRSNFAGRGQILCTSATFIFCRYW